MVSLSKTSKRVMANIYEPVARGNYKRTMLDAEATMAKMAKLKPRPALGEKEKD